MKPALVLEMARDFAEAIRANPLAVRDVQELLEALALTHADLVAADVPEADLRELAVVLKSTRGGVKSRKYMRDSGNWCFHAVFGASLHRGDHILSFANLAKEAFAKAIER
jgi:hypothetical protein